MEGKRKKLRKIREVVEGVVRINDGRGIRTSEGKFGEPKWGNKEKIRGELLEDLGEIRVGK